SQRQQAHGPRSTCQRCHQRQIKKRDDNRTAREHDNRASVLQAIAGEIYRTRNWRGQQNAEDQISHSTDETTKHGRASFRQFINTLVLRNRVEIVQRWIVIVDDQTFRRFRGCDLLNKRLANRHHCEMDHWRRRRFSNRNLRFKRELLVGGNRFAHVVFFSFRCVCNRGRECRSWLTHFGWRGLMCSFDSLESSDDQRIHGRHLRWWQQVELRWVDCSLDTLSFSFDCFACGLTCAFFLYFAHSLAQLFTPLGHRVTRHTGKFNQCAFSLSVAS